MDDLRSACNHFRYFSLTDIRLYADVFTVSPHLHM